LGVIYSRNQWLIYNIYKVYRKYNTATRQPDDVTLDIGDSVVFVAVPAQGDQVAIATIAVIDLVLARDFSDNLGTIEVIVRSDTVNRLAGPT
jgi:hypothetical protein